MKKDIILVQDTKVLNIVRTALNSPAPEKGVVFNLFNIYDAKVTNEEKPSELPKADPKPVKVIDSGTFKEKLRLFLTTPGPNGQENKIAALEQMAMRIMTEECDGNMRKASRKLGITYRAFYYKAQKYGITPIE